MIPPALQVVSIAAMYFFCALMFLRNEQLQHPEDQIGDPIIAKALALIWPMICLGVALGLLMRILMFLLDHLLHWTMLALDWAAPRWIHYRKPA